MKRQETDPLSGLRASPAPRELSGPVLEAARDALAARATQTAWDRAWTSHGFRVAWVSATAGLLAAHLFVTIVPRRSPTDEPVRAADARPVADELTSIARLPRIERTALDPIFEAVGASERKTARKGEQS
jgi:hypothetical protein